MLKNFKKQPQGHSLILFNTKNVFNVSTYMFNNEKDLY